MKRLSSLFWIALVLCFVAVRHGSPADAAAAAAPKADLKGKDAAAIHASIKPDSLFALEVFVSPKSGHAVLRITETQQAAAAQAAAAKPVDCFLDHRALQGGALFLETVDPKRNPMPSAGKVEGVSGQKILDAIALVRTTQTEKLTKEAYDEITNNCGVLVTRMLSASGVPEADGSKIISAMVDLQLKKNFFTDNIKEKRKRDIADEKEKEAVKKDIMQSLLAAYKKPSFRQRIQAAVRLKQHAHN